MDILKNLFGKKKDPVSGYADFWKWFQVHQKTFYAVIRSGEHPEKDFFSKLSPKLEELHADIYFSVGMWDANTAELVFTPDGAVHNIVFIENLVNAAPTFPNWKFTALKPALDLKDMAIALGGYQFDGNTLSFYAQEDPEYPDEVDLVMVHRNYNEEHESEIINGTFLFLDNFLGELNSVTTIDNVTVRSPQQAEKDLIPIAKLKAYLIWREKEFIEKYSGTRYDTETDGYSILEATLENGLPLIAIVNTTILEWDRKASHPWILSIEVAYQGNAQGMPDGETSELLNEFEDEILVDLPDFEGYLNVGRQTVNHERTIYFACKDFRKPSLLLHDLIHKYHGRLEVSYGFYKDKYWQSFDRFRS